MLQTQKQGFSPVRNSVNSSKSSSPLKKPSPEEQFLLWLSFGFEFDKVILVSNDEELEKIKNQLVCEVCKKNLAQQVAGPNKTLICIPCLKIQLTFFTNQDCKIPLISDIVQQIDFQNPNTKDLMILNPKVIDQIKQNGVELGDNKFTFKCRYSSQGCNYVSDLFGDAYQKYFHDICCEFNVNNSAQEKQINQKRKESVLSQSNTSLENAESFILGQSDNNLFGFKQGSPIQNKTHVNSKKNVNKIQTGFSLHSLEQNSIENLGFLMSNLPLESSNPIYYQQQQQMYQQSQQQTNPQKQNSSSLELSESTTTTTNTTVEPASATMASHQKLMEKLKKKMKNLSVNDKLQSQQILELQQFLKTEQQKSMQLQQKVTYLEAQLRQVMQMVQNQQVIKQQQQQQFQQQEFSSPELKAVNNQNNNNNINKFSPFLVGRTESFDEAFESSIWGNNDSHQLSQSASPLRLKPPQKNQNKPPNQILFPYQNQQLQQQQQMSPQLTFLQNMNQQLLPQQQQPQFVSNNSFMFQNGNQEKQGKVQYITSENNTTSICNLSKKVISFSATPLLSMCNFRIDNIRNHQLVVGVMAIEDKQRHQGYSMSKTLMYQEDGQLVINNKGMWEKIAIVPTFTQNDVISFAPGEGQVSIYKNQAQVAYWKYQFSFNILYPFVEFTTHQQQVTFI